MVKAVRITAIVIASLVVIFFGVQFWAGAKIRSVIEKKIPEMTQGRYRVEVGKVGVSLLNRSVRVREIRLTADTAAVGSGHRDPMIINLSVDRIRAGGLSLRMLRNPDKIDLGSLSFLSPRITIDTYTPAISDDPAEDAAISADVAHEGVQAVAGASAETSRAVLDDPEPGKKKQGVYTIGDLRMEDANILVRRHNGDEIASYELAGLQLDVKGFSTDTTSVRERKLHWFNDASLYVRKITYITPYDSNYLIVDTLSYDSRDGRFSLAALNLEPQYPKEQFAYKDPKHADWTKIGSGAIDIFGLKLIRSDSLEVVHADSVGIASATVESYKDRNAPQVAKVKKLFYEGLHRLPFRVEADVAHIGSVDVTYWEVPQFNNEAGVINFTGLTGTFIGLSNVPDEQEPFFTLSAHGKIYGQGNLQATFYLPKDSLTNRFEVQGVLGSMDMKAFNKMIIPLANAEIDKGRIGQMKFHIAGNQVVSHVDMTLTYSDLDIALLKHKDDGVKERRFISWIANTFVVKSDNPDRHGLRTGSGETKRDFQRSQFNYLWRSLMPGIKESAGL